MKDKTAMQELLEWTRKTLPMDLDTPRMIEAKIESLLPVEKEQIKDAWLSGQDDGATICTPNQHYPDEDYYKETYGKNN
jgi:hypothetical protein